MGVNTKKKHVSKDLIWKIIGISAFIFVTLLFLCDIVYIGNIKKQGIKLNAYVESIDNNGLSSGGESDGGIYADITYVYQGIEYQTRINKGLDTTVSSNKNVIIFVNPKKPEHVVLESAGQISALIMLFFGSCSALLIYDITKYFNKYKRTSYKSKEKYSSFIE